MFAFRGSGVGFYPRLQNYYHLHRYSQGDLRLRISEFGLRIFRKSRQEAASSRQQGTISHLPSHISHLISQIFNLHYARVYDQGQASVDESGSLLCVRANGCGRWRAAFPETRGRDGHRHADASAHAQ